MNVLNLTQHIATPDQAEVGVFDLTGETRQKVIEAMTFSILPTRQEVTAAAAVMAGVAASIAFQEAAAGRPLDAVMVGGAPFLMAPLERALEAAGLVPVYAFSRRESVDEVLPDGGIKKVAVFRHAGFVPACS